MHVCPVAVSAVCLGLCLRVVMGSLQQALGQAFNGMSMGRPWKAQRTGWASSRSGSSSSLSGAEPSSVASAAETDASLSAETHCTGSGSSADTVARLSSPSQRGWRAKCSFVLREQIDRGGNAIKFRDAFAEEHHHVYGWKRAFLQQECHIVDCKSQAAKLWLKQLDCAVKVARKGTEK